MAFTRKKMDRVEDEKNKGVLGFGNENEGQSERESKKSKGHFERRRFLQNHLIIITF